MKLNPAIFIPSGLALAAIVVGIILGLAFPSPGIASLGWIAPGLLAFLLIHGDNFFKPVPGLNSNHNSPICAFKLGWLAGFSFWLLTLRWLLLMPFPSGAIMGWLSLSAYLACYMGLWSWLLHKMGRKMQLFRFSLFAASAWVTLEWVRGWLFSGFAWNMLGVSQHDNIPLAQLASWTSVYGISFLMVAFSISWIIGGYDWISALKSNHALKEDMRERFMGVFSTRYFKEGAFWLLILCLLIGWGSHTISKKSQRPTHQAQMTFSIALVQPGIPQTLLWDPQENENRFFELLQTTRDMIGTNHIDLLVWPEAALPGYIRYDSEISNLVSKMAIDLRCPIIFCSDDVEPDPKNSEKKHFLNCAFMMDDQGNLIERYAKRHLVIFGEYVPLYEYLPFLKYFTPITGNYSTGKEAKTFPWPNKHNPISPLICFEDVFPEEVRKHASGTVSALVYLVNAGWFKQSSAHWQHLANAQFRSIENALPAIRCTQNGITCWIDRSGRVHEIFYDQSGNPYGKGGQIIKIPVGEVFSDAPQSFYRRAGNIFAWCCIVWFLREVVFSFLRRGKKQS
ncbi:MAG: apolipoprotein N-acyltransferase [Verrucomicrobia bacterium]|nr:apolipoprotein N-acyltransferase [Verrucomicrobiota bacterium]